jgi:eukaryotic-like serine/threonine-protein kinase
VRSVLQKRPVRWRPRVPKRVVAYFDEHRILKLVIYCGLAAFMLGYVFITLLFFPFGRSAIVTVPDVRGRSETAAGRLLGRVDLELVKATPLNHPTIRAGHVLSQVPLPGQEAARGSEVQVIFSDGPERRPVPSIKGLDRDEAIALLHRMGFRVGLRRVQDDALEGSILGMEPKEGEQAPASGLVVLLVSSGPPKVPVPSVLALPEGEARARLEEAGLRLGRISYDSLSTEPLGGIISQSPVAGDSLGMGRGVRVVISGRDPTPEPPPQDSTPAAPPPPDTTPTEPSDTLRLPRRR